MRSGDRQYTAVLSLISIALVPALFIFAALRNQSRKPILGFREKIGFAKKTSQKIETGKIWLHGVSMGEVLLMKLLVPMLEKATGKKCLLSCSTSSGREALEQQFPNHEKVFFPFDLPWAVNNFYSTHKPAVLFLLELELWPLVLAGAKRRGIPVHVLNARLSENSFQGYKRTPFLRIIIRSIQLALAQNQSWQNRLEKLGITSLNCGSLKADLVKPASTKERDTEFHALHLSTKKKTLLLASTSAPEERHIAKHIQKVIHENPRLSEDWQFICCPRHIERGAEIKNDLNAAGFECSLLSQGLNDTWPEAHNALLIIDAIGHLNALYALSDIAIVGGSLGSNRHGQNMLEAAAAGTCTIVGWDCSNFPDAVALLKDEGGLIQLSNINELSEQLSTLMYDTKERQILGRAAQRAFQRARGAQDRLQKILTKWRKSRG